MDGEVIFVVVGSVDISMDDRGGAEIKFYCIKDGGYKKGYCMGKEEVGGD